MTLMAAMMATLGTAVYLKDNDYEDSNALDIAQVLAVVVYMFAFGAGDHNMTIRTGRAQ